MATVKELRERRAGLWAEMRNLLDASAADGMSAEESAKYENLEAELTRLSTDLDARERAEAIESRLAAPQNAPEALVRKSAEYVDEARAYSRVFASYMKDGAAALSPEERKVLIAGRTENRALSVGTTTAGGFLVPQEFLARLNQRRAFFGSMRNNSTVFSTDSGADMPYPANDDTANVGSILAENATIGVLDTAFTSRTLKSFMYTSGLIQVSYQLLQDSAFNVDNFLADKFGERLGRIENTHFTTGTGSGQPEGIMTNIVAGKTGATGQTTTVTYDDLVDLIHSVDVAYRSGAVFMMHDLSVAKVRKLKDSTGQPLWQTSLAAGVPDTLLGYPVVINNDIAQMAANAKSILFGNVPAAYLVRDVRGVSVVRLDERYADALQVGFFAYARLDGQPAGPPGFGAVKSYVNSAT